MNASARVMELDGSIATRELHGELNSPEHVAAIEELSATRSPAMAELRHQIDRVATVDVPVLLLGESGAGKEFAARAIHARSLRNQRTFLKINCAALPSELLESELFGYESGAFTGAVRPKPGLFELCDHGTILLDEIGEIPPRLQAKLLHVLQDQQFSRLGGRRIITVDVRIIAATNIDINKALERKTFRADLYYRLNTITLHVPPLRERREDIPLFIDHFVDLLSVQLGCAPRPLSARAMQACLEYSWPGNVRELKSFICRHLVLQDDETLVAELLSISGPGAASQQGSTQASGLKPRIASIRAEAEKQLIEECLRKSRWNRTETARALHISTKTLWNKMRQYGITDSSRRGDLSNGERKREFPTVDSEADGNAESHFFGGMDKVRSIEFAKRAPLSTSSGTR
ncbi:MAG TPA: sigma-54 dependent transcriptional regulator [Candidatus Acidoferrales bacterium]|nr:sigma-54 dependent transcriptional regulator [Candidatus Acidoferrales bacterium]